MVLVKGKEIRRFIELEGADVVTEHFGTLLQEGRLNFDDFSIRELAEASVTTRDGSFCGREWVNSLNPRHESITMEAEGAIDTSTFSQLLSGLVFSQVMKAAQSPEFIYPKLQRVIPSNQVKELIPGITGISDDNGTNDDDTVAEGMPYPTVGFSEDYTETPVTTKKGRRLNVTKELLFFDKTGLVKQGADAIGGYLGRRREKNFCRLVAGLINNFKWRGTTYNTYQASAPWVNVKSGQGITVADGWSKIDAAEQLFDDMLDPFTNDPIQITPKTILAMPARRAQFKMVRSATQVVHSGATTSAFNQSVTGNPINEYDLVFSRWLYREIIASGVSASNAKDWWFFGDFAEAFAYIENWPITTVQAPDNAQANFEQDIVLQYKTSMKGVDAVTNPRAMSKQYEA